MKVLFISSKDVSWTSNGGELCTNRNYLSFVKLLGESNVSVVHLKAGEKRGFGNALVKRINYLRGYYEGLSPERWSTIKDLAKSHNIVFIDSSIHGKIAKKLWQVGYKGKIICFFHNVEYTIKKQRSRIQPWRQLEMRVTRTNEKNGAKYADEIVALNSRDEEELKRQYGVEECKIIPISLFDKLDSKIEEETAQPPTLIFTGNNWYANIHALDWFIENVLDHVNIKLQITGFRMDSLKEKYKHPKIDFLGFVDDLAAYLMKADYVVSPIFYGSGMKVKTCEAMMYGKNIIGTKESFEGYDVDFDKVGAQCNTKEEFIEAINRLGAEKRPKFNEASRSFFLEKYSFEATLKGFQELLD